MKNPEILQEYPNYNELFVNPTPSQRGLALPVVSLSTGCTATMISEKLAITAKHCVPSSNLVAARMYLESDSIYMHSSGQTVFEGSENHWALVKKVHDVCNEATGWCITNKDDLLIDHNNMEKYSLTAPAPDDVVVLELDRPLGKVTGFFETQQPSQKLPPYLHFGGFPGVRKYLSTYCKFEIVGQNNEVIVTNCMPKSGISGGPLFYEYQGVFYLVGVLSGELALKDPSSNRPFRGSIFHNLMNSSIIDIVNRLKHEQD